MRAIIDLRRASVRREIAASRTTWASVSARSPVWASRKSAVAAIGLAPPLGPRGIIPKPGLPEGCAPIDVAAPTNSVMPTARASVFMFLAWVRWKGWTSWIATTKSLFLFCQQRTIPFTLRRCEQAIQTLTRLVHHGLHPRPCLLANGIRGLELVPQDGIGERSLGGRQLQVAGKCIHRTLGTRATRTVRRWRPTRPWHRGRHHERDPRPLAPGERGSRRPPVQHTVVERDPERHTNREHRGHGDRRDEAGLPVGHWAGLRLPNGISSSAAFGRSADSIVQAELRPVAADSKAARVLSS